MKYSLPEYSPYTNQKRAEQRNNDYHPKTAQALERHGIPDYSTVSPFVNNSAGYIRKPLVNPIMTPPRSNSEPVPGGSDMQTPTTQPPVSGSPAPTMPSTPRITVPPSSAMPPTTPGTPRTTTPPAGSMPPTTPGTPRTTVPPAGGMPPTTPGTPRTTVPPAGAMPPTTPRTTIPPATGMPLTTPGTPRTTMPPSGGLPPTGGRPSTTPPAGGMPPTGAMPPTNGMPGTGTTVPPIMGAPTTGMPPLDMTTPSIPSPTIIPGMPPQTRTTNPPRTQEYQMRYGYMRNDECDEHDSGNSCNDMYMPERDMNPYHIPMGIPMMPLYGYDNCEDADRDWDYIKQMYPLTAKKIMVEIDDECDKLEYDGSCMFDEYPDRVYLSRIVDRIYDKVKYLDDDSSAHSESITTSPEETSIQISQYDRDYDRDDRDYRRDDRRDRDRDRDRRDRDRRDRDRRDRDRIRLRDFIEILLFNELLNRRRRFRGRRRWF